jgi:dUTPase
LRYKILSDSNYLPQISPDSNGIDLPFQKEVSMNPNETQKIGLGVRFLIPEGHCALLMNKSSALPKYKVKIILGLIDVGYNQEIVAVVQNATKHTINIPRGTAVCQLLLLPAKIPQLNAQWLEPCKSRGKFGSTGQDFKTKYDNKQNGAPPQATNRSHTENLNKTQLNLIKMAENSDISATSYMLSQGSQNRNRNLRCYALNDPRDRQGLDRKIHFPVYINKFRVVACSDSGSDLTLMQENLFYKIFGSKTLLQRSGVNDLRSYSSTSIKVRGQITCSVYFERGTASVDLTLVIIENIPNSITPFLFGNDSLRKCLATLSYTGNRDNPLPEVSIKNPIEKNLHVYYTSPKVYMSAKTVYELKPFETKMCEFTIHGAAPLVKTDEIILQPYEWQYAHILPSKSDIEFDYEKDCYLAKGAVSNLTNKEISGSLTVGWEIIEDFTQTPFIERNRKRLLSLLMEKNPVRQIIPEISNIDISIPRITVNNVNWNPGKSELRESQDKLDMSNVLGGNKESYTGEAEIDSQIIDPGLDIPTLVHKSPQEAINLNQFEPEIRPYIKDIFLNKHPNAVSLHSLDAGDISKTLGYTTLRLIPGEKLPRHKRIFQLSPQDTQYMEELIEQFIKYNYVRRAPIETTDIHLYGMSTYVVPRKNKLDIGRLVIDFSPLTTIIQSPPSVVPDIAASLQNLQGKALYSSIDLRYAYLSLKIDEQSRPLTTFLTPRGAYQWLSIPTGAACSPAYFIDAVNRILHYKPARDQNGKPIYEAENKVKLIRDVLPNSFHYFDDIICGSEPRETYKMTLDFHFSCLEKIVERLSFHGAKMNVGKSTFAKPKILFLGWVVSHDFITPDPRRMEKIKKAKFPTTKKEVRAFIGLVNSIRRVVPLEILKEVQILTPLTSSSKTVLFEPNKKHFEAFEKIKSKLISEPLFCNLIRPESTKYLWVDAASSSGCLGAVLAQKISGEKEKTVPTYINLNDPVHRIIYDNNLLYEPCTLYTKLPIVLPKASAEKTVPPQINDLNELKGYSKENVHNSLFWSFVSVCVLYGCKTPDTTNELRKLTVKEIKKGILGIKLKDQSFNNYHGKYRQFLNEFENGQHNVDKDWILVEALAKATHRCLIFLSTLKQHENQKVLKYNTESTKPPIIFGVYKSAEGPIFTPYYYNKNREFSIDSLKNKVQIVAYLAKTVPEQFKSRSILDLEVFSILNALHSLQRYIYNSTCHLLTDSRVLYYLFHQKVGDTSVKIRRWVLKLISDYPHVQLHFVRTTENLADYLTRQGLPRGDLEKLSLKDIEISDFYDKLPKHDFTLEEWADFCVQNPQYLTVNKREAINVVSAVDIGLQNLRDITEPLKILEERLGRENIVINQKEEFKNIIENCLKNKSFEYTTTGDKPKEYKLQIGLLLIKFHEEYKILLPKKLIGPLLAYTHLLGHIGVNKMLKNMNEYYFENMYSITKKFIGCCHGCFLNHGSSRKNVQGIYPTPEYPMQEISVDIAESLNRVNGYSHLLIVQCALSDFIMIFPLKSKTANEINRVFLYSIFQYFNIRRVHSDNATCFRQKEVLKLWGALGIEVINSSAQNPAARGKAEKAVHTVKLLMKKFLTTSSSESLNWETLPYLVSKIVNNTVCVKTGQKPAHMLFGTGQISKTFLDRPEIYPHHSLRNNKQIIEKLNKEIILQSKEAQKEITESKMVHTQGVNKNKIEKKFNKDDIVFVLDRYVIEGNSRPLKSKFFASPCVVIKSYFTTTLTERVADNFRALYSNNDLKKYKETDPLYKDLPQPVKKVLLGKFQDFLNEDLKVILKYDPLDIPTGIDLKDTVDGTVQDNVLPFISPKKGEGSGQDSPIDFEGESSTGLPSTLQDPTTDFDRESSTGLPSPLQNEDDEEDEEDEDPSSMVLRNNKRVRFSN